MTDLDLDAWHLCPQCESINTVDAICPVCVLEDRQRAGRAKPLSQIGDAMQSATARLCAHLRRVGADYPLPYEEQMALLEAERAVDEWTQARRKAA